MRIGIIGAGQIGGTLARRLTALGHDVSIANSRGPETLAALASETGARAVTVERAARAGVRDDVVVVDTGNYYPQQRDGRIDAIENGTTESRWVSQRLGRPVVKTFNNIYAHHLLERGKPRGAAGRVALPVAGDDPRAKLWNYDLGKLESHSLECSHTDPRAKISNGPQSADCMSDKHRELVPSRSPKPQVEYPNVFWLPSKPIDL